jgi:hypothetical protein
MSGWLKVVAAALVVTFVASVVPVCACPGEPAAAARHDCCTPEAGFHASPDGCCEHGSSSVAGTPALAGAVSPAPAPAVELHSGALLAGALLTLAPSARHSLHTTAPPVLRI